MGEKGTPGRETAFMWHVGNSVIFEETKVKQILTNDSPSSKSRAMISSVSHLLTQPPQCRNSIPGKRSQEIWGIPPSTRFLLMGRSSTRGAAGREQRTPIILPQLVHKADTANREDQWLQPQPAPHMQSKGQAAVPPGSGATAQRSAKAREAGCKNREP